MDFAEFCRKLLTNIIEKYSGNQSNYSPWRGIFPWEKRIATSKVCGNEWRNITFCWNIRHIPWPDFRRNYMFWKRPITGRTFPSANTVFAASFALLQRTVRDMEWVPGGITSRSATGGGLVVFLMVQPNEWPMTIKGTLKLHAMAMAVRNALLSSETWYCSVCRWFLRHNGGAWFLVYTQKQWNQGQCFTRNSPLTTDQSQTQHS